MSGGSVRFDGWQRPILGTSRSTSMKEREDACWLGALERCDVTVPTTTEIVPGEVLATEKMKSCVPEGGGAIRN